MRKIKHKNPEKIMQFLYSLRSKGVLDKRVLSAMEEMDRAEFIKGPFEERAYDDVPLPISCAQTISQPSIVGLMTQALDVQPRNKVLEIGTGSGYQAAILSKLSRRVYTLDRHAKLTNYVEKLFVRLNINNVTVLSKDGCLGLPEQAPFDRIMVTAAAEDPPTHLLKQLKVGGKMIIPVGQSDSIQKLIKVFRKETEFIYEELFPVRFVPLIEGLSPN